jgi:hypothetical protein
MYLQSWVFIAPYENECIHIEDTSTVPYKPFNNLACQVFGQFHKVSAETQTQDFWNCKRDATN